MVKLVEPVRITHGDIYTAASGVSPEYNTVLEAGGRQEAAVPSGGGAGG